MTSTDNEDGLNCDIARIENFKYSDNTKGSTLVTNANSELVVVAPALDDQILVADSTSATGVKWFTVPTDVSIFFSSIIGSILTYANATSYSLFNPHTVTLPVSSNYVEIQFIHKPQTLLKLIVYPSSNYNWPSGSNFTFDVGYLRNLAGIGPPMNFSTVSASTNSFVPIVGSTLTVNNTYSGTRNSAIITVNIPVSGPEYLCVRCINSTATAGLILTCNIIMKSIG